MAIEKISSTVSKPKSGMDVKTVQGMMRYANPQTTLGTLAPSYIAQQLAEFRWPPSTAGPAGLNECFLRQSTHKLVSDARSGENVNDWLLPSLVIDAPELFLGLARLGARQLEDSTASTETLILALKEISLRLSRKRSHETNHSMQWQITKQRRTAASRKQAPSRHRPQPHRRRK